MSEDVLKGISLAVGLLIVVGVGGFIFTLSRNMVETGTAKWKVFVLWPVVAVILGWMADTSVASSSEMIIFGLVFICVLGWLGIAKAKPPSF